MERHDALILGPLCFCPILLAHVEGLDQCGDIRLPAIRLLPELRFPSARTGMSLYVEACRCGRSCFDVLADKRRVLRGVRPAARKKDFRVSSRDARVAKIPRAAASVVSRLLL